ncbi:type II secretion system F family protein [Nonomuraea sp. NPDC050328]|uniref:type II secretion system F family protein n=1 Tax=Nonomuraea sp. NPDC050328 TaxID=3364361 RepID=UPI003799635D
MTTTVLIAAIATALAVWLWTGPTQASTRLTHLLLPTTPLNWQAVQARLTRPSPARRADAWRTASLELCQGLCAELSAGLPPGDALTRAVAATAFPTPEAPRLLTAAARDGGEVARTLREIAPRTGGEGFHRLAACWEVSVTVGSGLSALVERVARSLRTAQAHRQDVAAQLAGPRATARMLAALPALGLLMALALGMDPFGFLLGSLPGLACLLLGLALDACGLWWTHRMAVQAET